MCPGTHDFLTVHGGLLSDDREYDEICQDSMIHFFSLVCYTLDLRWFGAEDRKKCLRYGQHGIKLLELPESYFYHFLMASHGTFHLLPRQIIHVILHCTLGNGGNPAGNQKNVVNLLESKWAALVHHKEYL